MDRRRPGAAVLAGAAALLLGGAAVEPPLRALRWLAPGADPVAAATREPAECLRRPADRDEAWRIEVGRAAFRSPLLLGGQASRAGLSCESCHRAGRDAPRFHFAGLSGDPGTADVTASVFSSHRGDGVFNPRPIPDLSGPRAALKVAPADRRRFIRGLVVEEFDGPEPTAAVLDGLAAYVAALDPAACPAGDRPVTAAGHLSDARRAVGAAVQALDRDDRPTALTMIAAARRRLGDVDERLAGPALDKPRRALRALDAVLADAAVAVRAGETARTRTLLAAVPPRLTRLAGQIEATRGLTLYAPTRVRAALH